MTTTTTTQQSVYNLVCQQHVIQRLLVGLLGGGLR
jgi:hypothetical protein